MKQYQIAINALPFQQRQVFGLVRERGLSHQETADKLEISIHTVKRHLSEAMKTLRTKIPEHTLTGILIVSEIHSKIFS